MIIAPIVHFNPRAPCGARPRMQSTRAATAHFNPRAPCGARPHSLLTVYRAAGISIHAPLAGRDVQGMSTPGIQCGFQSTRPLRGATLPSPNALTITSDFNPRAPCGARPTPRRPRLSGGTFQSTRPLRGATLGDVVCADIGFISIHAPLAGRDSPNTPDKIHARNFNPRAPCGARHPSRPRPPIACRYFNPRAPCGARRQRAGYEL